MRPFWELYFYHSIDIPTFSSLHNSLFPHYSPHPMPLHTRFKWRRHYGSAPRPSSFTAPWYTTPRWKGTCISIASSVYFAPESDRCVGLWELADFSHPLGTATHPEAKNNLPSGLENPEMVGLSHLPILSRARDPLIKRSVLYCR